MSGPAVPPGQPNPVAAGVAQPPAQPVAQPPAQPAAQQKQEEKKQEPKKPPAERIQELARQMTQDVNYHKLIAFQVAGGDAKIQAQLDRTLEGYYPWKKLENGFQGTKLQVECDKLYTGIQGIPDNLRGSFGKIVDKMEEQFREEFHSMMSGNAFNGAGMGVAIKDAKDAFAELVKGQPNAGDLTKAFNDRLDDIKGDVLKKHMEDLVATMTRLQDNYKHSMLEIVLTKDTQKKTFTKIAEPGEDEPQEDAQMSVDKPFVKAKPGKYQSSPDSEFIVRFSEDKDSKAGKIEVLGKASKTNWFWAGDNEFMRANKEKMDFAKSKLHASEIVIDFPKLSKEEHVDLAISRFKDLLKAATEKDLMVTMGPTFENMLSKHKSADEIRVLMAEAKKTIDARKDKMSRAGGGTGVANYVADAQRVLTGRETDQTSTVDGIKAGDKKASDVQQEVHPIAPPVSGAGVAPAHPADPARVSAEITAQNAQLASLQKAAALFDAQAQAARADLAKFANHDFSKGELFGCKSYKDFAAKLKKGLEVLRAQIVASAESLDARVKLGDVQAAPQGPGDPKRIDPAAALAPLSDAASPTFKSRFEAPLAELDTVAKNVRDQAVVVAPPRVG